MDQVSKLLTEEYNKLCQVLGSLSLQKEKLESNIQAVKQRLESIDQTAAQFISLAKKQQEEQAKKIEDFIKEREKSGAKVELSDNNVG